MLCHTVGLAVVALLAAACAAPVSADPAGPTATPSAALDGRLVGSGTVLDDGSGPSLCSAVADSYPPQCDGVELVGWRWPEQGVERAGGTTWGDFAVVGTYDGLRLTVEKTVDPATLPLPVDEPLPGTPCPEPAGGWRAPDPVRATEATREQALRLAAGRPGYADAWVETLGTPGDPLTTVLNLSFTKDLAGAERAVRQVWGGMLCVSKAERSRARLERIQQELNKTPGMIGSSYGFGHASLTVVHDDGSLQRRLDRTYGAGVVRVSSVLQPYAAAGSTAPSTPGPSVTPSATPSAALDGRLVGSGTVIDEGSGPSLCFIVLQSLPPQCGTGVKLRGWRWPDRGVERKGKTTWGDFAVVGRYDGKRFVVAKTVDPATLPPPDEWSPRGTPCPEPAGGWRAPDPGRATKETQDEALRLGARLPGYADAWVEERGGLGSPVGTVLNFSFTRDLPGAERALRKVWGGMLCVSRGERTRAELTKIQRELSDIPHLSGSLGFGHVDIQVVYDDGTLQRRLDQKYGAGLVRVESALKPYTE